MTIDKLPIPEGIKYKAFADMTPGDRFYRWDLDRNEEWVVVSVGEKWSISMPAKYPITSLENQHANLSCMRVHAIATRQMKLF